jgi:hypothetical protein
VDGKNNEASGGSIIVQLTTHTLILAAETAITNARQDTGQIGVMDTVAVSGFINNDNFLKSLRIVVTKLDAFVQIVDKAAKVCR